MSSLSLVVTLCLAAGLAGSPTFDEGMQLFREAEYEQAIFRFQRMSIEPGLSDSDRAEALLWLGISYASAGDEQGARRAFADAVSLDRELRPPPTTSPKIVAIFDDVVASLPPPPAEVPAEAGVVDEVTDAPPPAPAAPSEGPPWLLLTGGAVGAIGAAVLVGGLATTALAAASLGKVDDRRTSQIDAHRALEEANLLIGVSAALLPTGAVLVAAAGGMLAVSLSGE